MTQSCIGLGIGVVTLGQTQGAGEQLVPAGDAGAVTGGTTSAPGTASTQGATQTPNNGLGMMIYIPLILVVVFMLWSSTRAQKKEQTRRQEMLKGLHRGDKVQTIGGVIGTIADLGDDEVVLTLEQGRVRVTKAAIQQVVRPTNSNSKAEAVVESKPEASKTANA